MFSYAIVMTPLIYLVVGTEFSEPELTAVRTTGHGNAVGGVSAGSYTKWFLLYQSFFYTFLG